MKIALPSHPATTRHYRPNNSRSRGPGDRPARTGHRAPLNYFEVSITFGVRTGFDACVLTLGLIVGVVTPSFDCTPGRFSFFELSIFAFEWKTVTGFVSAMMSSLSCVVEVMPPDGRRVRRKAAIAWLRA